MIKKVLIIFSLFFMFTSSVFASVSLQEIMYNPEGSDTNREWIEILNDGSSIDISSWYLYENDTYHGLYPDGFTTLGQGERALIVKDIATAQAELGSHKFIKASFSLNNTGETLILANDQKNTVDSVAYSSNMGANGDGRSLQRVQSIWIAATPTPGSENSGNNTQQDNTIEDNNQNDDGVNKDSATTQMINPFYTAQLSVPSVILAQSDFILHADVSYTDENKKTTRKLGGYYYLNFGNGDSFVSNKRIDMHYRYRLSGDYIVSFEYYHSKLSFDMGEDPDAFVQKTIHITQHNIEILSVDSFKGVVLKNNTSQVVQLDGWKIVWNKYVYTFPRRSYLAGGNTMPVLFRTLGFYPKVDLQHPLNLLSNASKPITFFPKKQNFVKKKKTYKKSLLISPQKKRNNSKKTIDMKDTPKEISIDFDQLPDATKNNFFDDNVSYLNRYLKDNPNKLQVDFHDGDTFSAVVEKKEKQDNNFFYVLGSLIFMLGIGRFIKHKHEQEKKGEEMENLGSIEVIE